MTLVVFDAAFSWLTAALWAVALGIYALRVARFGSVHNDRVAAIGGTALMGEDIMRATYWAIAPVVRGIVRLGITANGVTWSALVLGVAAGIAIAAGSFGLACLLATMSTLGDVLDGQVARVTGKVSARGGFLDSVIDRYTEFALIGGFVLYAHDRVEAAIALGALLASFMSSYATAKAEILAVKTPRGLMRRHERAAFLIMGAGMTPILGPALHDRWPSLPASTVFAIGLALVAVIGNVAVIQRLVWVARAIRR